jgi:hypothetical protein
MMNKDILYDILEKARPYTRDQEPIYRITRFVLEYINEKFPNTQYTKEQKLLENISYTIWNMFMLKYKPIIIDDDEVINAFKKDINNANKIEELKFNNVIELITPMGANCFYLKALQEKLEEY